MLIKSAESEEMTIFFDKENQPNAQVQMGIITLQPGEKRPLAGYARHEQDEYSYVISGEAHTILEDGQDLVGKAGQAQLIEAGEGTLIIMMGWSKRSLSGCLWKGQNKRGAVFL